MGGGSSFPFFFLLSFLCDCDSFGAHHILGQAWAEGKGELATFRLRADCGLETSFVYLA